jgi:hypothetical protein
MILVYPMIVSQAVSENIVPGLAKAVESYILIYAKDTIITNPYVQRNFNFKIKGGKLYAHENINFTQEGVEDWEKGKKEVPGTDSKEKDRFDKDSIQQQRLALDKEKEKRRRKEREEDREEKRQEKEAERIKQAKIEKAKRASASIKMTDTKTISVEPTVMDIDFTDRYGNKMTQSFGVKVLAFRVKSDEKLSRLILHDAKLNMFNATMISLGRKITRRVWSFIDRWRSKFNELTPSGDPRRDIIMARTGHKVDGYIVMSKTEDMDEVFLSNVSRINRLFKMGWGNIIIADDINRIAYFCMKQFKGVCVAISYPMIYQNFGQLQVYSSLEDIKRQSSSLFKVRKPLRKVLGEWVAEYRYSKYLSEEK